MRKTVGTLIGLALLFLATPSHAVGPLVGTNCLAGFTPPAFLSDGVTPITTPITYNYWLVSGVQTAPAVPQKGTGIPSGTPILPCLGVTTAGQYTFFLDDTVGGVESSVNGLPVPAFSFVLVIPAAPAGLTCTATTCSWTAVTANTDGTAVGPVSYEVWDMPGTPTAPTGSPTTVTTATTLPATPLVAGKYTRFVRTLSTPTPGGSTSESAASSAPFAVATPSHPSSVTVK